MAVEGLLIELQDKLSSLAAAHTADVSSRDAEISRLRSLLDLQDNEQELLRSTSAQSNSKIAWSGRKSQLTRRDSLASQESLFGLDQRPTLLTSHGSGKSALAVNSSSPTAWQTISASLRGCWEFSEDGLARLQSCAMWSSQRTTSLERPAAAPGSTAIHPESSFRIGLTICGVLLLGYDAVTVPLSVFAVGPLLFAEWCVTLFWSLDLGLNCVTGYRVGLTVEMRLWNAFQQYLRGWLLFDGSVLLVGWVVLIAETASLKHASQTMRTLHKFRAIRLLRFLRFRTAFREFRRWQRSDSFLTVFPLLCFSFVLAFLCHASACIWFGLGNMPQGWAQQQGLETSAAWVQYTSSFQWSLSRLHPMNLRYMDELHTGAERVFSVFATACAVVVGSVMVSFITNRMAEMKRRQALRVSKIQLITDMAHKHDLSSSLVRRLRSYIDHVYVMKVRGDDEAELLRVLPEGMLQDLAGEIWSPALSSSSFFFELQQSCSRALLKIASDAIVEVRAYMGDVLFARGDRADSAFFVAAGKLSYDASGALTDESWPVYVEQNTCVSELALWSVWHRQGLLEATGVACVASLSAETLATVLQSHPSALAEAVIHARDTVDLMLTTSRILTDLPDFQARHAAGRRSTVRISMLGQAGLREEGSERSHRFTWLFDKSTLA